MTELNWIKIIFCAIAVLILIASVKKGWRRGLSGELKAFVSVVVAMLCLVLILVLRNAVKDHTYGSVIVIGAALVILATGWKLVKLILSPLSGFKEIRLVKTVDSLLGAAVGALEGCAFIWVAIKIYNLIQG